MSKFDRNAALLVVDMQVGFDDPRWGVRNNQGIEMQVAALLRAWRAIGAPIFHVHHASASPSGLLRLGTPGNASKPEAEPLEGEAVYQKSVNSAFLGTTLERDLRDQGIETIFIVGLTTNHCISTTARMAANLGFETFVVLDATAAFEGVGLEGQRRSADEVHQGALADLQDEFAEIVDTQAVLSAVARVSREDILEGQHAACPGLY